MSDNDDDAQDVALILLGGDSARAGVDHLYRKYRDRLFNWFRRRVPRAEDAEELVNETFLKIFRGIRTLRADSTFFAWMWAIAGNVLKDYYKQVGAAPRLVPQEMQPEATTDNHHEDDLDMQECVRQGFARFASAHPERADAIVRGVVEGWTAKELGTFLGRNPGATRQFLSQCRKVLMPFIEHCWSLLAGDRKEAP